MIEITGRRSAAIVAEIEAAVTEGRLRPGERLPAVRDLAARLGVGAATAASAYRALSQRGVVVSDGRRGTAVSDAPALGVGPPAGLAEGVRNLSLGNPDPRLLPDLRAALAGIRTEHRLYGEAPILPELEALAGRALAADGIPARHLAIVSGALDGMERVIVARLRPGDRVAVEDPGFPAIRDLAGACGLRPIPVPVDAEGMVPEGLGSALRTGARAVILTPRAQNPTGASLTGARRDALLAVLAAHPETLVIEDDFAGPISGAPAVTLAAGGRERWAVVRSVSKSLGPDLRVAFLAGDETTLARIQWRQAAGAGWVSHLLQRTVVRLWRDPSTIVTIERASRIYGERRRALLDALRDAGVVAHGGSGLNVWVPVVDEAVTRQGLLERGWAVAAGERFRIRSRAAVRITAATLEPEESQRLAADLAAVLRMRATTRTA